ncbi:MAG: YkgJ family cysteine cluster protein [Planctomycetes bacterium]|nr:YkgJ family cysteine cluster protein [Planctomycetota bacterium]
MVAGCGTNNRLLGKVAEIYTWLDTQIRDNNKLTGQCNACGKCCDFDSPEQGFDHRLFVTSPELMYLTTGQQAANLGAENIKSMPTNRCPYNIDGKCTVYEYRFAGCRIFYCNGDADFQSGLSESVLEKLKSLCTEFQIPYRYTDLAEALNSLADAQ